MAKNALVVISNGTEEMEAVITIDILRRASINVVVASVQNDQFITCSRGVKIVPDCLLSSRSLQEIYETFDIIALPGGLGGAEAFSKDETVQTLLSKFLSDKSKLVCLICAAPISLLPNNLITKERKLTSHPSMKEKFHNRATYVEERVVVDGNLITSRGPGTSIEFALKIVECCLGKDVCESVRGPLVI